MPAPLVMWEETADQSKGRIAVYVLFDETLAPRYVGVTKDPKRRLKDHVRESFSLRSHRHHWVRSLIRRGVEPQMAVVEWTNDWRGAEQWWIAKLRTVGCSLVNGNNGGNDMGYIRPNYAAVGRLVRHIGGLVAALKISFGQTAPEVEKAQQLEALMSGLLQDIKFKGDDVFRDFDNWLALNDGW